MLAQEPTCPRSMGQRGNSDGDENELNKLQRSVPLSPSLYLFRRSFSIEKCVNNLQPHAKWLSDWPRSGMETAGPDEK